MQRCAILGIALAAALAAAACKRAPAPPSGPPASKLPMTQEVPAEAEVSASSGAVKLTLRVYKTRIKTGESLWLQVVFTDVSSQPLMVRQEDYAYLPGLLGARYGFGLEFTDSRGKRATGLFSHIKEEVPLACMTEKEQAPWWAFRHAVESGQVDESRPVTWLKPGESAASDSLAYQSSSDKYCARLPPPKAIRPFAEIAPSEAVPPGKYTLTGVYDKLPLPNRPAYPGIAKFITPPITIEVVP